MIEASQRGTLVLGATYRAMSISRTFVFRGAAILSAALLAFTGTVGNLVRGAGFPSGSDEAIAEHDGELGLSLGPFAGRHFPL
ncbi:MAG: hypothetical protein WCF81_00610, partial [Roseiarcus sp.]